MVVSETVILSVFTVTFSPERRYVRGADNKEANKRTVETAAKFLGRGVAAVDLAGAEALFPTADYEELFAPCSFKELSSVYIALRIPSFV